MFLDDDIKFNKNSFKRYSLGRKSDTYFGKGE